MNIKEIRKKTGLSQIKFAKLLNIPVRTIEEWEAERRKPKNYIIELIEYKIKKEIEEKN